MTIVKSLAVGTVVYGLAWLLTYIVFMSGDMKYLREYFILSWSNPGEIPAYIQGVAVIFGLIGGLIAFYRMNRSF